MPSAYRLEELAAEFQRLKSKTVTTDDVFERRMRSHAHLMATRLQPDAQRDIGLDVAS